MLKLIHLLHTKLLPLLFLYLDYPILTPVSSRKSIFVKLYYLSKLGKFLQYKIVNDMSVFYSRFLQFVIRKQMVVICKLYFTMRKNRELVNILYRKTKNYKKLISVLFLTQKIIWFSMVLLLFLYLLLCRFVAFHLPAYSYQVLCLELRLPDLFCHRVILLLDLS